MAGRPIIPCGGCPDHTAPKTCEANCERFKAYKDECKKFSSYKKSYYAPLHYLAESRAVRDHRYFHCTADRFGANRRKTT